ncbi:hypothetical protein C2G38_2031237 [Gigaspora rosea]|uniref:Uncharacterized protein n=1 Tax=Gigaspora rosea TaxID=44941 RepID=A0A397VTI2_9GLOM|nr:hypothetical protein C2G38_2031237 [Gigaspora rosea]
MTHILPLISNHKEYHKLCSQLQIVKLEDLVPLYKILPKSTQNVLENIIFDNFHIIMTGVAEIKRENQTYVNIQLAHSLPDNDYEMFGNLVTNDMERVPDVMIQFSLANQHGCRATIHKFNREYVFWFFKFDGDMKHDFINAVI